MMTSKLDHALSLAVRGFHVFPIESGRKAPPRIDDFPHKASRDPDQIRRWWTCPVLAYEQDFNIGVSTSRFGDNEALLVVDVDNKGNKNGDKTLLELENTLGLLPLTYEVSTPSGGRHLVYRTPVATKQGVDILGDGCDIRSAGGYVVGAGSTVDLGEYIFGPHSATQPALAPDWLVAACGLREETKSPLAGLVDPDRATARGVEVLRTAGVALEGERNHKCFLLANWLKDLGVPEAACVPLLQEYWDCRPMLDAVELHTSVASAYRSANSAFGSAAPESQFTAIPILRKTLLRRLLDFCTAV